MPPAQLRVLVIRYLLGDLIDAHYCLLRENFYRFIVNIGFFHLWYYNIPDRSQVWTIIFGIIHTLIPGVVPNPRPGIAISRDILMGVYHLFISCQKHILSNKRTIYDTYINEYDRCVLAGYDTFTCHQRGVYAANVSWDNKYRGIPMVAPACDFPSLTDPPPNPNPIGVGLPLRKDRGPPFGHPPPSPSFLSSSIAYWIATYPGAHFAPDLALPPGSWKNAVLRNTPMADVSGLIALQPAAGSR